MKQGSKNRNKNALAQDLFLESVHRKINNSYNISRSLEIKIHQRLKIISEMIDIQRKIKPQYKLYLMGLLIY